MKRIPLKGLTLPELESFVLSQGLERYRARQLFHWMYYRRAKSFDQMTNLRKDLRQRLSEIAELHSVQIDHQQLSPESGAVKFLFQLRDGERVEGVFIPDGRRRTVCLSTQVGCPLGCTFCATGKMGFRRNLTAGEIVDQLIAIERLLDTEATNVVMMGMGEPFLNYENVIKAAQLIANPEGIAISQRKITLSTAGYVPAIYRFANEGHRFKLAISLNATTDELRSQLMPINQKFDLEKLLEAARHYVRKSRKRVTFEYVLIAGMNDSRSDARRLRRLLKGIPCKINLIPYNEIDGGGFQPPDERAVNQFAQWLADFAATVTIRRSQGGDIKAACGQLCVL